MLPQSLLKAGNHCPRKKSRRLSWKRHHRVDGEDFVKVQGTTLSLPGTEVWSNDSISQNSISWGQNHIIQPHSLNQRDNLLICGDTQSPHNQWILSLRVDVYGRLNPKHRVAGSAWYPNKEKRQWNVLGASLRQPDVSIPSRDGLANGFQAACQYPVELWNHFASHIQTPLKKKNRI